MQPVPVQRNEFEIAAIGFGFSSDGPKMWREVFKPVIANAELLSNTLYARRLHISISHFISSFVVQD